MPFVCLGWDYVSCVRRLHLVALWHGRFNQGGFIFEDKVGFNTSIPRIMSGVVFLAYVEPDELRKSFQVSSTILPQDAKVGGTVGRGKAEIRGS